MSGDKNERLASALDGLGWSPESLARRVNRVLGNGTVHEKTPYKWLNGREPQRPTVRQAVAEILSDALGETVRTSDLWPRTEGADLSVNKAIDLPWTAEGMRTFADEIVRRGWMIRRKFLALSGTVMTAPVLDWLVRDQEPMRERTDGEQITPTMIEAVHRRIADLRRLDDEQGGAAVLDWTQHELAWVAELVRRGAYDANMGYSLYSAFAELAQLAGWMAFDAGEHNLAQWDWIAALRASHAIGNRAFGAHVASCMAYQATWLGKTHHASTIIGVAREGAHGRAPGAVQALLATRHARVHAASRNVTQCRTMLDAAREAYGSSDQSDNPAWSYWVIPAVLEADAGRCMLELGEYQEAERLLTSGLLLFGNDQPRNRMLHLASLTEARLLQNNLDGAAEPASHALDLVEVLRSSRCLERATRIRDLLWPYRDVACIRDVAQRADTLTPRR